MSDWLTEAILEEDAETDWLTKAILEEDTEYNVLRSATVDFLESNKRVLNDELKATKRILSEEAAGCSESIEQSRVELRSV